jgi:hypothetical protein
VNWLRVIDESGAPVPGAKINVHTAQPTLLSDERGCFHYFKVTSPSRHEAAFLVEAQGHQTYLGTIAAPGRALVIVRIPHEGPARYATMENLAAPDPSCTRPRAGAAQQGVAPDGRPRTAARR